MAYQDGLWCGGGNYVDAFMRNVNWEEVIRRMVMTRKIKALG